MKEENMQEQGLLGRMWDKTKAVASRAYDKAAEVVEKGVKVVAVALGVVTVAAHEVTAQAAVAIPEVMGTGVGVSDYITAAIVSLGGVVAVVVGGFFAFRVVKMALRWVGVIG